MRGLGWSQSKNLRTTIVISRDDSGVGEQGNADRGL